MTGSYRRDAGNLAKTFTILQDDREKKPLLLPSTLTILDPGKSPLSLPSKKVLIEVEKTHLPTGDYLLKGSPHRMIIERKGHLDEVATNCLTRNGRRKFTNELIRLNEECLHPVLLLEGSPRELSARRHYSKIPKDLARDALQRLCIEYGIELLLLPNASLSARKAVGEWAAALLINASFTHRNPK